MKKFFLTHRKLSIFILSLLVIFLGFYIWSFGAAGKLNAIYESLESAKIYDRNGEIIEIQPNEKSFYASYLEKVPEKFRNALIAKEDRFFPYHLGVNPVSTLSATWDKLTGATPRASSTITQQLVKILLNQEQKRTVGNKLREMFAAFALELHTDKEDILNMYANSVYFGNQVQGLELASQLYFDTNSELLTDEQIKQLLATIPSPSETNPFESGDSKGRKEKFKQAVRSEATFEIDSLGSQITDHRSQNIQDPRSVIRDPHLTLDTALTAKIRALAKEELTQLADQNVSQTAVVVIKLPENELLAIVGSSDPTSNESGSQINMAVKARPIGSTIKPFIYTQAFTQGLRPYTLVDDKEYKYDTAAGFAFYPKNYDYKYNGIVNLHYALSNSLNVPTVKVLEYVGLDKFYNFLLKQLEIKPVQELDRYQLGIALGQLEMSLLELTYDFTLFSNAGQLKPLRISATDQLYKQNKKIFAEKYVQLINQILIDRATGIDQFGLLSNLNLGNAKVAVKTGTSREYHDSWTIGYTPDFVVGVWVGNAKNTAMDSVSGSLGAGRIWNRTVQLLLNSPYNKKRTFGTKLLTTYPDGANLEYGLPGDDFEKAKNLLISEEKSLISSPHDGDIFLLEDSTKIPLTASSEVDWYIDGELLGKGIEAVFEPKETGNFTIQAEEANGERQEVEVVVESLEL